MNNDQRQQITGAGHRERNHVTAGPLQHMPYNLCHKPASNCARHATDSRDRAHRSYRKHVGGQRVKVSGKALMARSRKSDQQHR